MRVWQIVTVACSASSSIASGLPDDVRAADDDRVGARERRAGQLEQLHHRLRGRRCERRQPGGEPAEADRARPVDVLAESDPLAGLGERQPVGERSQAEDPVDGAVGRERVEAGENRRAVGRQPLLAQLDPGGRRCLRDRAQIPGRARIVGGDHDREHRRGAGSGAVGRLRADLRGQRAAVEQRHPADRARTAATIASACSRRSVAPAANRSYVSRVSESEIEATLASMFTSDVWIAARAAPAAAAPSEITLTLPSGTILSTRSRICIATSAVERATSAAADERVLDLAAPLVDLVLGLLRKLVRGDHRTERLRVLLREPERVRAEARGAVADGGHRLVVLGVGGLADRQVAHHLEQRGRHRGLERGRRAAAGCGRRGRQSVQPAADRFALHGCNLENAPVIADLAQSLGLQPDEVLAYGPSAAKIELSAIDRLAGRPDGRIVSVTSMTPTRFGEGKTTTSISLTQGLGAIGEKPMLCLREPSLGPVFGLKGGGTGGGRAQVVPMEEINLHFTGDIHAIGAANNLLAAMVDSHLLQGNDLGLDPHSITWRRCVDMDDRVLRQTVVGLGGRANGVPRETGFDITAASEVMAIVAVARDLTDLRTRLGAITVGSTYEGEPVTAEQIGAAGSMAVLLKQALKPNLVQTLEGQPALLHCGPFANIAHGNNSLVADRLGLKLGDWIVTESGFGADMGFEKFVDIVCRLGGFGPSVVVLVATVQALKHHGGDVDGGLAELELGFANLRAALRIVQAFGLPCVVAINRFSKDSAAEIEAARSLAAELPVQGVAVNDGFERGGEGAVELAEAVVAAAPPVVPGRSFLYDARRPDRARRSPRSRRRPTVPPASSSLPQPAPRRSGSRRPASVARRSAWPRRICRSRTIRR